MNTIVRMKFGAHLYGTATPDSDLDYKGVFMPSREEVLLGRIPKSHNRSTRKDGARNSKDDVDVEVYSLHYFIKLACDGQTVALDMIHAPEGMILESSPVWESIVENRKRFYTRNIISFIDYARRQASKYGIKGSRISAVQGVLETLKREDSSKRLRDIWDRLPRVEHCYDVAPDPSGMRQYQVCGKSFQESASISYVIPILEKFYSDYGQRARLAAENRNIDWKKKFGAMLKGCSI